MTTITFLIGNGFDLNVGLQTRYKDFYKYYIEKYPFDFLARAIKGDFDYWSDLEEGLGKYTEEISKENERTFWESEERLEEELASYFEGQMKRVDMEGREGETALEMIRSLTEFYQEFPKLRQKSINNILDSERNIIYYFITFNYTDVLEQCLDVAKQAKPEYLKKLNSSGRLVTYRIADVLHIHGTTDKEMVLGVNDEKQIANKGFVNNYLYRQYLIKAETNISYENGKIEEACSIIDDSSIIYIFGMSIGKTDKMWWQYICKWLQNDKGRILIINVKTKETGVGKHNFRCQDEMKRKLKNNADMPYEEWEEIASQIHVWCKSDIFNFKFLEGK